MPAEDFALDRAWAHLVEQEGEILEALIDRYKAGRPCHWPTVAPARIHQVWDRYVRTGHVPDDGSFESIVNGLKDCILQLKIFTILAGHEQYSAREYYDRTESNAFFDAMYEWGEKTAPSAPISDYALVPLQNALVQAMAAKTTAQRIKMVDRILNMAHQRGDLSALLVTGGRPQVLGLPEVSPEDEQDAVPERTRARQPHF